MNIILGIEEFKDHYDENDVDRDFTAVTKKIYENYLEVPSDEIWPENILATTLKQVEYYWDSDYFKSTEEALAILSHLGALVDHAEKMAAKSRKLEVGDKSAQTYSEFNLYQSDVLLGQNTVLTIANQKTTAYISHMTFLTLSTTSQNYTAQTDQWLKKITSKSNLISGISEKHRVKFFRTLRKAIDQTVERIKNS